MKKIILGIALLLFIAIGGGIFYLFHNLDNIVKIAIEKYGSEAIKTQVRVDRVRIKLQEGSASISGLTIANPPGFSMPYAFSLGDISVGIDINSLTGNVIVIREIGIAAPQVFFEVNADKKTNLNVLSKNLGTSAENPPPEEKSGAEPRLIISKAALSDAELQALVVPLDNKEYQLKLPTITMNNLGAPKGAPPAEIARQMLDQLLDRVKAEVKKQGIGAELKEKLNAQKEALKTEADAKLEAEKAAAKKKTDAKKKAAQDKLKQKLGQ
ncbi:MAG TPA: hypothetical protein VFX02_13070 [Gammaproteobacteria bacterium]|nr:hypothetical protein [Gammaproteobacteria bacterium]